MSAVERRLTPQHTIVSQASRFAMLLAWLLYVTVWRYGSPDAVVIRVIRFGLLAGVVVTTALYLFILWRGVKATRDFGTALLAGLLTGTCAALLWFRVHPGDWSPLAVYLLRGFYWAVLGASIARIARFLKVARIVRQWRARSRP
jgi:hypothetical protein